MDWSALNLNVGCGADHYGDVRVDVTKHFLNYNMVPNILCDAHHLPFRDKSFYLVKCTNVLEHMKAPFEVIKECNRVARSIVLFAFPTERDIFPTLLLNLLPPKLNLYYVLKTRSARLHLWIIKYVMVARFLRGLGWKVRVFKLSACVVPMLEYGRKAAKIKWVSERLRIGMEYKVVGWKG